MSKGGEREQSHCRGRYRDGTAERDGVTVVIDPASREVTRYPLPEDTVIFRIERLIIDFERTRTGF